ncbi:MAG TPA: hypothetical protein VFU47_12960 [Armatimonadota bacterium]|nr:hypothetical protein [Armatimonadota bacterium]
MTVLYADLSHHDWSRHGGMPDWVKIRQATSPALCIRLSYGDPGGFNPPSPYCRSMATAARRDGFDLIGGYHNLVRGDSASIGRQVDYFRRELDAAGCEWAMLDVERYPELVQRGIHPTWATVRAFYDRWRRVEQRVLALYLPRWIWDGHMSRPDLRTVNAPLVASDYGSNPDGSPSAVYKARGGDSGRGWSAYGGVVPSIWQYGSNVDCPGASGQTDLNAYRGSYAELRALLTGEDDMALSDADRKLLEEILDRTRGIDERVYTALAKGLDAVPDRHGFPDAGEASWLVAALKGLQASVTSLPDAVAAKLRGGDVAALVDVLAGAGVDLSALRTELERRAAVRA